MSFDDVYQSADTFDDVYREIADRLVTAAEEAASNGESIVYMVPGSPLVLERTVQRLRSDSRVEVVLHPAIGFLDLVWARLAIDPIESTVTLVDGHGFATAAA